MAWSCDQYQEWVAREVREPIERQRQERREKCKKKKCKRWCLCCNKWFCWIETVFYYIIEWIVRLIFEWIVYTVCRIVSAIISLLLLILNILGWIFRWGYCMFWGDSDLDKLPMANVQLHVVIVHKDKKTKNPITSAEIDNHIYNAKLILEHRAKISVERRGEIRETYSGTLWALDQSSNWAKVSEYLKGIIFLIGRDSPRYLTVYVVGSIEGAEGLHQPLYGSVFIKAGIPGTTLAHELGHSMLAVWNAYHNSNRGYLMYVPWTEREVDSGWSTGTSTPKLSRNERCTMRRSRWLDWSWFPFLV